jgi:hypothetical protein
MIESRIERQVKPMSRRTRIEFEPLSLEETAKQLGVPHQRAKRILTLIGADVVPGLRGHGAGKRRSTRYKLARKSSRSR